MKVSAALLLCAMCLLGSEAQCPEPSTLKDAEGTKLCARLFEDSNYYYDQSCGGEFLDIYPNDDVPIIPWRWNNRVSSLVVNKSCSLTVWSRIKKNGNKKKFSSGIQYRLKEVSQGLFGDWDNSISAYYCVC
ncbi:syncollin-like [Colossoma macropomum]|uniref:syncollin-like n=1 Tax=Colossoma macropomum TaxID=42526 RepID=UPI001864567D|nr:syncollin-like [Colossoma macropomum]